MNVNHVHQEDEHHFTRCSHPACDVTINRMRKYYLLRTKENKVMEMYEQAVKSHDDIIKRRASLDMSHLTVPDVNYENFLNNFSFTPIASPNHRRFSLPTSKRGSSELRPLSPRTLSTLNELADDGNNEAIENSPLLSPAQCESSRCSPSPSPLPQDCNASTTRYQQRSYSMTSLSINTNIFENLSAPTSPHRSLKDLSLSPVHDRHLQARKKLDERKQLLNSLDTDIRKVDSMLKTINCNSMPSLNETNNVSNEQKALIQGHELIRKRTLSSEL